MASDADTGPLGILAGSGALPGRLAEAAASRGRGVLIIAFKGQADPKTVDGFPHLWVDLGQASITISALKQAGVVDLVMAGAVRRPSLAELGLDWRGVQLFARIGARALGDDGLLRAVARELEAEGFRLLRVDEVLRESASVSAGPLGRFRPDGQAETDIARGIEVARTLGQVDVGQAVVVQQGLVLGVEAIEGTNGLLERVRTLRREGPGGVLIKIAKPGQDRRMDMPTIGPETVVAAIAAGLRGIAIETDGVILLDRRVTIDAADQASLFLFGIAPGPKE
jgi:DUF1009 family protein